MLLRYIEEHISEELSIDVLAEQAFLSKYHLMRLFREETGTTIMAYLTQLRMDKAKSLLRSTAAGLEVVLRTTDSSPVGDFCSAVRLEEVGIGLLTKRNTLQTTGKGFAVILEEEVVGHIVDLYGLIAGGEGLAVAQEIIVILGVTVGDFFVTGGVSTAIFGEQHVRSPVAQRNGLHGTKDCLTVFVKVEVILFATDGNSLIAGVEALTVTEEVEVTFLAI